MGFSQAVRTYVGIQIGKKRHKTAKKFAEWGVIINVIIMYVPAVFFLLFSRQISEFFTDIESTVEVLTHMLFNYGIIVGIDCCLWTYTTLLRFANQIVFLNLNSFFLMFCIPSIVTGFGLFVWDLREWAIIIYYYVA